MVPGSKGFRYAPSQPERTLEGRTGLARRLRQGAGLAFCSYEFCSYEFCGYELLYVVCGAAGLPARQQRR